MTNAITLATATTHGGGIPAPLTIVLVIAAVGYVLWSRMQGRPLKVRRLVVLPAVLVVLGIVDITGSSAPHLTPKDVAFLLVSVAMSVILGAARGVTIELYPEQGELWQRYRRSTVALWIVLIGSKVVLAVIASAAHALPGGGTNSLLLSLGVSLLAEAAIVGPRALSTGLPFAAGHKEPQTRSTSPYGDARPPAPRRDELGRDDRAQWSPPQQESDGYRSDGYRSDRRHSHSGPIHRLLGAAADRRRATGSWTGANTRPPAPTRSAPFRDDAEQDEDDRDDSGQWRSPTVRDGVSWLRHQSGRTD